MANKVVGFLRKAFPVLNAIASFGGPPAVLAAQAVGAVLGAAPSDSTPDAIDAAIQNANLTPDQLVQLKKVEADLQTQMAQIGLQYDTQMAALVTADVANARARQIALKDHFPEYLTAIITAMFGFFLWFDSTHVVPAASQSIVYGFTGSLGTAWITAVAYFLGSSAGSAKKTDLLAQAPPVQK